MHVTPLGMITSPPLPLYSFNTPSSISKSAGSELAAGIAFASALEAAVASILFSTFFCDASLHSASFRSSSLRSASLRAASLHAASFCSVSLRSTSLRSASLRSASRRASSCCCSSYSSFVPNSRFPHWLQNIAASTFPAPQLRQYFIAGAAAFFCSSSRRSSSCFRFSYSSFVPKSRFPHCPQKFTFMGFSSPQLRQYFTACGLMSIMREGRSSRLRTHSLPPKKSFSVDFIAPSFSP